MSRRRSTPTVRSEVVPEPARHRDGDRRRCVKCWKVAFPDEETARRAREMIGEGCGVWMRPYLARCGWWHLARTTKQRRRDRRGRAD